MSIFGNHKGTTGEELIEGAAELARKKKRTRNIIIGVVALVVVAAGAAVWKVSTWAKAPDVKAAGVTTSAGSGSSNEDALLNEGDRIADFFTFVVCATDIDETRTDSIMVVAFDAKEHTVNVLNVPRDTMSDVDRKGANRKINAAYHGGIEETKDDLGLLLGFRPDKYIVVNFQGIADIVDAIGGVDYEIPFRMKYDDPAQDLHIDFEAGYQHLDGKQTVEFLRWRKNNAGIEPSGYENGDEDRVKKQQIFLKYLAGQVFSASNITKLPSLCGVVADSISTDLTSGEIVWLAMQTAQVQSDSIQMFTLPGDYSMSYAGTSTMYSFFFPNKTAILDLVNQYFNPYNMPITNISVVDAPDDVSFSNGETKIDDDLNDVDKSTAVTVTIEDDNRTDSNQESTSDEDRDSEKTSSNSNNNSTSNTNKKPATTKPSTSTGTSGNSGGTTNESTGGDTNNNPSGSTGGTTTGGETGNSGGTTGELDPEGGSGSSGNSGNSGESGGTTGGNTGGTTGGNAGEGGDTTGGAAVDPEA